ncbi:C-C motif chemokine 16 [Lagenorhynchus albirostris]|uniref:C-C motif chemokine 16 n=1 Tax=Lagenorhynchus albirostris TaxID=27610 RepID=UPI0028F07956|nr:C-C motif chemokine 16 [Lagenorhynchus albirostris]
MKVSAAALSLLSSPLLLPFTARQVKIPESVNPPPACCLKYHEKVLPKKVVVRYRKALNCYLPAIIFITRRKREICTNPNNERVQEYIKDPRLPLHPSRKLV